MSTHSKNHHVILIEVDQWAGFLLSCLPDSPVSTPHLDAIATEGTVFTRAVCNSPICLPSRLSMLSGTHPGTTGQFGFAGLCRNNTPWMPETFRQSGFHTASIGKFHCRSIGLKRWNFEVSEPTLLEEEDFATTPEDSYASYCRAHGLQYPHDQMHGHDPATGKHVTFSSQAPAEGHPMYRMSARSDIPVEHSVETWTTNRAINFLQQRAEESTFSWISFHRPHFPTTLPEPYYSRAMEMKRRLSLDPLPNEQAFRMMTGLERHEHIEGCSSNKIGEEAFRHILATYFTLIEWIDSEVGRLCHYLKQHDLEDTTTLVFTSDHGDEAGRQGLYNKTRGIQSWPIVNVPLIIKPASALHPTAQRGQKIETPVSLVDLFPTLCNLADIPQPESLEGKSLALSLLAGKLPARGRVVFTEDSYMCAGQQRLAVSALSGNLRYLFDTAPSERRLRLIEGTSEKDVSEHDHLSACIQIKKQLLAHLCSEAYGEYTDEDKAFIEEALDPESSILAPHHIGARRTVWYRAAAGYRDENWFMFVPFYERDILLFRRKSPDGRDDYWKSSMAVEPEAQLINCLLTKAIEDIAPLISSASILRNLHNSPVGDAGFSQEKT